MYKLFKEYCAWFFKNILSFRSTVFHEIIFEFWVDIGWLRTLQFLQIWRSLLKYFSRTKILIFIPKNILEKINRRLKDNIFLRVKGKNIVFGEKLPEVINFNPKKVFQSAYYFLFFYSSHKLIWFCAQKLSKNLSFIYDISIDLHIRTTKIMIKSFLYVCQSNCGHGNITISKKRGLVGVSYLKMLDLDWVRWLGSLEKFCDPENLSDLSPKLLRV